MARLREHYKQRVVPALLKKHGYKNVMQVPRLEKVVINRGVGEAVQNAKLIDSMVDELKAITGQKPVITKARRSIAAFKLRVGMQIGCMVTLRGKRMYEFFDRLVNVAMPRIRDFKGVSTKGMDGRGNYNLGLSEQIIFPEVDYDKVEKIKGMNVVFVTTAATNEEAKSLLQELGMPFRD
jgi:large subunit ribosomal protein L5